SVSGRLTVGDVPAVGVEVALVPEASDAHRRTIKGKTDQDGRYLLDSLTSGFYTIHVIAPAMAVRGEDVQDHPQTRGSGYNRSRQAGRYRSRYCFGHRCSRYRPSSWDSAVQPIASREPGIFLLFSLPGDTFYQP